MGQCACFQTDSQSNFKVPEEEPGGKEKNAGPFPVTEKEADVVENHHMKEIKLAIKENNENKIVNKQEDIEFPNKLREEGEEDKKKINSDSKNASVKTDFKFTGKGAKQNPELKETDQNYFLQRVENKTEIRITIVGGEKVGKSVFGIRIKNNTYEKMYIPSVYLEPIKIEQNFNNHKYILNFSITPGKEEYQLDYTELYKGTDIFLIFFDLSDLNTFNHAKKIYENIIQNKYQYKIGTNESNVYLIGNMLDIKNINQQDTSNYANNNSMFYHEISVKSNKNVFLLLKAIVSFFDKYAFQDKVN